MIRSKTTNDQSSKDEVYNLLNNLNRQIIKQKLDIYGIKDDEYSTISNFYNGHIAESGISVNDLNNTNSTVNNTNPFKAKLKTKYKINA
jgi:hypothetical protein